MQTTLKALGARVGGRSLRETYWSATRLVSEMRRGRVVSGGYFWRHAKRDFRRYVSGSITPVRGEEKQRCEAAIAWLLRAQQATQDDGVSLGYFPCDEKSPSGWRASYPETTGYIITSLINSARALNDSSLLEPARRMGRWEATVQMPSGAVQGGPVCAADRQTPAAFNTGMVLDGWCSLLTESFKEPYATAARRAADFLVGDLNSEGYFRTNGTYVGPGEIKTYTCLCAWAMFRYGNLVGIDSYRRAAVRAVQAAVRQQQPNGWFANNCLTRPSAPLTHTIGYTLQGVLEVGVLAQREDFIAAVTRCLSAIESRVRPNGFLAGRFFSDWSPAAVSSCLTGSAQIAGVSYRLAEIAGEERFAALADRLVDFLKALQATSSGSASIDGALAGSFPIFGEYMRGGYPNWATKYLLDALMLQHQRSRLNGLSPGNVDATQGSIGAVGHMPHEEPI